MIVLGVDPGCPGGWAILGSVGNIIACGLGVVDDGQLSPTMIEVLQYAAASYSREWYSAIESFPPRPMMHVKSIAGLFAGIGAWRMAIRAASFDAPAKVDPKEWQARFRVAFKSAESALRLQYPTISGKAWRDKVQQSHREVYHDAAFAMWPSAKELFGPKGGKRHDVAAALWIAEHRRMEVLKS
jgi:hypothetical protein